jgi:hypothetical protein
MTERPADYEALRDLKARYCRYADTKRWDDMAALFTDDGVMRIATLDLVLQRPQPARTAS